LVRVAFLQIQNDHMKTVNINFVKNPAPKAQVVKVNDITPSLEGRGDRGGCRKQSSQNTPTLPSPLKGEGIISEPRDSVFEEFFD
jgi:hypothetical protein